MAVESSCVSCPLKAWSLAHSVQTGAVMPGDWSPPPPAAASHVFSSVVSLELDYVLAIYSPCSYCHRRRWPGPRVLLRSQSQVTALRDHGHGWLPLRCSVSLGAETFYFRESVSDSSLSSSRQCDVLLWNRVQFPHSGVKEKSD